MRPICSRLSWRMSSQRISKWRNWCTCIWCGMPRNNKTSPCCRFRRSNVRSKIPINWFGRVHCVCCPAFVCRWLCQSWCWPYAIQRPIWARMCERLPPMPFQSCTIWMSSKRMNWSRSSRSCCRIERRWLWARQWWHSKKCARNVSIWYTKTIGNYAICWWTLTNGVKWSSSICWRDMRERNSSIRTLMPTVIVSMILAAAVVMRIDHFMMKHRPLSRTMMVTTVTKMMRKKQKKRHDNRQRSRPITHWIQIIGCCCVKRNRYSRVAMHRSWWLSCNCITMWRPATRSVSSRRLWFGCCAATRRYRVSYSRALRPCRRNANRFSKRIWNRFSCAPAIPRTSNFWN